MRSLFPENDLKKTQPSEDRRLATAPRDLYVPDGNSTLTRDQYYAVRYGERAPEIEPDA